MAVTFLTGFEGQAVSVDGGFALSGTAAYSGTQARTGVRSARLNPASGANGNVSSLPNTLSYVHFGLYVASLPSLNRSIYSGASADRLNLRLTSAGALALYQNTTLIGTSSAAFATPGWHWVGVRNVTGTSVVLLQIDGSDEVTGTATITAQPGIIGFAASEASAVDVYIDDIIYDDTGFLAPSKVDFSLPISDNSITGWTDGNGGTTNIFQGVNNTPPVGVASANEAANPNASIRATSNVGGQYIVNCETYTSLGLVTGDTVIAAQAVVRHGEDISTGTKNGTMQSVGNPLISDSTNFTFGNDGGAHTAETGVWVTYLGPFATSGNLASVTLGNSPTISIARALSESRVGCVDFMGLLFAWTPAPAETRVPYTSRYRQILAH